MKQRVEFQDLGVKSYGDCWEYQQQLFDKLIARKRSHANSAEMLSDNFAGWILMVEHPAVYTLGKSGKSDNMLLSEERIAAIGAEFYQIDRGGDITFHGEGQIVCYPIIDLEMVGIGLKQYIDSLEEAVIETVAHFGIESGRIEGASGVWITNKSTAPRKICAIGVRSSRYITMHGLALNVLTDLQFFNNINPCGFTDRGVTSLEVECKTAPTMEEVKELLLNNLIKILNVKI